MDKRLKHQVKTFLRKAWDEGLEGRVLMVQNRLRSARDMPEDHRKALDEMAGPRYAPPPQSAPSGATIH